MSTRTYPYQQVARQDVHAESWLYEAQDPRSSQDLYRAQRDYDTQREGHGTSTQDGFPIQCGGYSNHRSGFPGQTGSQATQLSYDIPSDPQFISRSPYSTLNGYPASTSYYSYEAQNSYSTHCDNSYYKCTENNDDWQRRNVDQRRKEDEAQDLIGRYDLAYARQSQSASMLVESRNPMYERDQITGGLRPWAPYYASPAHEPYFRREHPQLEEFNCDTERHLETLPRTVGKVDCPFARGGRRPCGREGQNGFTRPDHFKEHLRKMHNFGYLGGIGCSDPPQ